MHWCAWRMLGPASARAGRGLALKPSGWMLAPSGVMYTPSGLMAMPVAEIAAPVGRLLMMHGAYTRPVRAVVASETLCV